MGAAITTAVGTITPVSIMPGIYAGIIAFLVGLWVIYETWPQPGYWVKYKCNGEPCDETSAPSISTIVGFEVLVAAILAFFVGSGVYKLMFYAKNPKILGVLTVEEELAKPLATII